MKDFDKTFFGKLHKELWPFLKSLETMKENEVFKKRFMADLLGEDYPEASTSLVESSPYFEYLRELLSEYGELNKSIERIRLSAKFISQSPPSRSRISKTTYIRYHFEFYLNEIYIFKERLDRLLARLEKKCRKARLKKEEKALRESKREIEEAFSSFVKIRGKHVHLRRYEDNKMRQLELLETLSEFNVVATLRDFEYEQFKKKTVNQITAIAKTLEGVINNFLGGSIEEIIFKKLPAVYKAKSKKD